MRVAASTAGASDEPEPCHEGPKRYRYYVTHASHVDAAAPARRVAAHDLEKIVVARLATYLGDPAARVGERSTEIVDARRIEGAIVDANASCRHC